MNARTRFGKRIRAFFRKPQLDAEMAEEMREHLELRVERNLAAGMSPPEARSAAFRAFGGVEQIKERCRDQRAGVWLDHLLQDFRYAARQLARSPAFTAIAVLSLALGIGANTTIFSLVNEFLLSSLPVRHPEELVLLRNTAGARGGGMARWEEGNGEVDPATGRRTSTSFSWPTFEQFRAHHPGLSDVIAYAPIYQLNLLVDGQPELNALGQFVSGNYHTGLGVVALLGRTFTPADDLPGAAPVAVISHRCWQSRFHGDPAVLGRTIQLNKVPASIVGVTPPRFEGAMQIGESADVSVPLGQVARFETDRGADKVLPWYWWLRIMGRLAPGTTATQARAALEPVFQESAREGWLAAQALEKDSGSEMPDLPCLSADPGAQGENDTRREYASSLYILIGLVSLVLFASCANVANLLLARGAARRREIALRLAVGASRGRIVRQLLTESILLAFLGASLGIALAWWSRGLLLALRPFGGTSAILDLPLDAHVLGFTVAVAISTALLFGLAPALRATSGNLIAEFQGGARTLGNVGRSRLSQALMVIQVALTLVLLVTTGLFLRTLSNLQSVDAGFNRNSLAVFRLEASGAGYTAEQLAALNNRLQERLGQLPGVRGVTFSRVALLTRGSMTRTISIEGYTPPPGTAMGVHSNVLAANFFATMEIPLVAGRGFTSRDNATAPMVAVINQALAQQFFRHENPLGRRVAFGGAGEAPQIEIVGVARDAKYTALRDAVPPTIYLAAAQNPEGSVNFAVRTSDSPAAILPAIRSAVREIDPTLPVLGLRTHDEQIERLHSQETLFARLSGLFGLVALTLACVGLYGLMSYTVLRRTGEIGLRMALGALPLQVLAMILRESLALVCAGVLLGVLAAMGAGRLIASMLFGLSPTDPSTFATVALILFAIALVASLLPAWRASRVDPMTALRPD